MFARLSGTVRCHGHMIGHDRQLTVSHRLYAVVYTQFAKLDLDGKIKEVQKMVQHKRPLSLTHVSQLGKALATGEFNAKQAVQLIELYFNAPYDQNQHEFLDRIWKQMYKHPHKLDATAYRRMLHYYAVVGDATRAQAMFDQLISMGYYINIHVYTYLIRAYTPTGNAEKVEQIFKEVKERGLGLDDIAYNYKVQCYLNAEDIAGADVALDELKRTGCIIDRHTVCALLKSYAQRGDLTQFNHLIDRCHRNLLSDMSWILVNAIKELAANGYSSESSRLLPMLRSTYDLQTCISDSMFDFVRDQMSPLMLEIIVASGLDIPKNVKHLLGSMGQKATAAEFNKVWHQLNANGVTIESHGEVYDVAQKGGSLELLEAIIAHKFSSSMPLDEDWFKRWLTLAGERGFDQLNATLRSMCTMYCVKLKEHTEIPPFDCEQHPLETLATLKKLGVPPKNAATVIIRAFLLENNIETALNIVRKHVYDYNHKFVIEPLIDAYFQTRDTDSFIKIINHIRGNVFVRQEEEPKLNMETMQRTSDGFVARTVRAIIFDKRTDDELIGAFLQRLQCYSFMWLSKNHGKLLMQELQNNEAYSKIIPMLKKTMHR